MTLSFDPWLRHVVTTRHAIKFSKLVLDAVPTKSSTFFHKPLQTLHTQL